MVAVVARTIVVGIVFVGVAVAAVHPFAVVVDVPLPDDYAVVVVGVVVVVVDGVVCCCCCCCCWVSTIRKGELCML